MSLLCRILYEQDSTVFFFVSRVKTRLMVKKTIMTMMMGSLFLMVTYQMTRGWRMMKWKIVLKKMTKRYSMH